MSWTRRQASGLLVPIGVALLIPLGYFALTGNWTGLASPVASVVALGGGALGFAVGELLRRRRAKRPSARRAT